MKPKKLFIESGDYDKQNRCLNPTKGDLNNLLYSLNKSQGATKFDQKDLNELYENLQVDGHFVFYQPYHSKDVSYFFLLVNSDFTTIYKILLSVILITEYSV